MALRAAVSLVWLPLFAIVANAAVVDIKANALLCALHFRFHSAFQIVLCCAQTDDAQINFGSNSDAIIYRCSSSKLCTNASLSVTGAFVFA